MKEPTKQEMIKYIDNLPSKSFTNEHGEVFTIHSDGVLVFMSGDEVNAMVDNNLKMGKYIPLFNQSFSIWSKGELYKLGEALMELHK